MSNLVAEKNNIEGCIIAANNIKNAAETHNAIVTKWQADVRTWNTNRANISREKQIHDQRLRDGRYAPRGKIWHNGALITCNSYPYSGHGPFNLCGYHPDIHKKCRSCERQYNDSAYKLSGGQNCNCASCAEQCCQDCSFSSAIKDRRTSNYQGQYDSFMIRYRQVMAVQQPPTPPAFVLNAQVGCVSCSQTFNINEINATQSPIDINNINQEMNCLLQQKQTVINQIKGEEAARRREEAARLAAEQAARLAAQQAAQRAAAAAAAASTAEAQRRAQELQRQADAAAAAASAAEAQRVATQQSNERQRQEIIAANKAAVIENERRTAAAKAEYDNMLAQRQKMMMYFFIIIVVVVLAMGGIYFATSGSTPAPAPGHPPAGYVAQ